MWQLLGQYSGLALMMPAAVLIGFGIGYAIDQHFHTGHAFTVVFLFLGCLAALLEIVRVAGKT